jgi:hypothetical protein
MIPANLARFANLPAKSGPRSRATLKAIEKEEKHSAKQAQSRKPKIAEIAAILANTAPAASRHHTKRKQPSPASGKLDKAPEPAQKKTRIEATFVLRLEDSRIHMKETAVNSKMMKSQTSTKFQRHGEG